MAKVLLSEITTVSVARRFECLRYNGDDGYPAAVLLDVVFVTLMDGREFYLPNTKRIDTEEIANFPVQSYRPGIMVQRILDAREINLDYWLEIEHRTTEELSMDAWNEEVKDRMDHGDYRFGMH
jgi:hypothetical protein